MYTSTLYRCLLFLAFASVASCHSMRQADLKNTTQSAVDTSTPHVFFVSYRIRLDSVSGITNMELIQKTMTAAHMKQDRNTLPIPKPPYPNYLTIYTYRNNQLWDYQIIEHPLYKWVEAPDNNNKLSSKFITLKQAEFFIRLPVVGAQNKIGIFEILENKPTRELTSLGL